MINALFLTLSVLLSACRNVFSKKTAVTSGDNAQFFLSQTMLFFAAGLLMIVFNLDFYKEISALTVCYGVIYGLLLISAQWLYTLALRSGYTSVCSVIYSLGFIVPTIVGTIFWNEEFTIKNIIGLVLALSVILLTLKSDNTSSTGSKKFILFMIVSMLSAGGLGLMQKIQQTSEVSHETGAFLIVGFTVAVICSLIAIMISKKQYSYNSYILKKENIFPVLTGMSFGGVNFFNTVLAGRMKSAMFFPVQNIATVIACTLCGIIVFKEKLNLRILMILLLGIVTVIIFTI